MSCEDDHHVLKVKIKEKLRAGVFEYKNKYVYFNAPREILQATHSWNRETEPGNLQEEVDENFFYVTEEHYDTNRQYFGCSYDSAKEGLDDLAEGIATTRWRLWYLMVPYDSHFADVNTASKYLMNIFGKICRGLWLFHMMELKILQAILL